MGLLVFLKLLNVLCRTKCSCSLYRETLTTQLDLAETKAESERLARALLEEQYFELSQESKKAASRHRQEMTDKDSIIRRVNYSTVISIYIYLPAENRKLCFYFNL